MKLNWQPHRHSSLVTWRRQPHRPPPRGERLHSLPGALQLQLHHICSLSLTSAGWLAADCGVGGSGSSGAVF